MSRVFVAHLQANVLVGRTTVGERIGVVFDVRDAKRKIHGGQLRRHGSMLAGGCLCASGWFALVLIDTVLTFRVGHLLVKVFRPAALVLYLSALPVESRKNHRVTTAAQR